MKTIFRHIVVAGLVVGVLASSASAQTASSQRPYRGIFGGSGLLGDPKHSVDLTLNVLGAYDDNIYAEQGGVNLSAPAVGGFYTVFGGDGAYEWKGRRTQFGLTGNTALRYYNDASDLVTSGAMGVGFSTELARRTTLTVNQTVAYSPSYLTGLFPETGTPGPGSTPPTGADYAVDDVSSFQYGTSLSLSRGITQRATLSGTIDYRFTNYLQNSTLREDSEDLLARVELARTMNRTTSLRVAYRYRNGDQGSTILGYAPGEKTTEHGFEVGMDYTKALSPTRRFVFAFGVGSTAADFPVASAGVLPVVPADSGRQYSVLGDASLSYQFNRTWEARASYRRGLEYIPQLLEPVYSDGFAATIGGLFSQKVDFSAGASVSMGSPAASVLSLQSNNAYDTYAFNARVRRAMTKTLAAYLEYVYYYYDFGRAQLQPGVPPTMERNGVRAGITLWLPVVRR